MQPPNSPLDLSDSYSGEKAPLPAPVVPSPGQFLGLVVLCLIGFLFFAQYMVFQSSWNPGGSALEATQKIVGYEYDEKRLRSAYLISNGGIEQLKTLRVLRATGFIVNEQSRQEFVIIRHFPNRGRFTYITGDDTQVAFTVTEDDAWMTLYLGQEGIHEVPLEQEQAAQFAAMAKFFNPLMRWALNNEGQLLSIENNIIYNRKPAVMVKLRHEDSPNPSGYFLDPETLWTLGKFDYDAEGNVLQEQVFLDHRQVNGMNQPFKVISRTKGQPDSIVEFSQIQFNQPILTGIYHRKADQNATDLPEGAESQ